MRRHHPPAGDLAGLGIKPLSGDLRPMLIQTHHDRHHVSPSRRTPARAACNPTHRIPWITVGLPTRMTGRAGATARAFNVCRSTRRAGHLHPTDTPDCCSCHLWQELGCDAGADDAAAEALADRLTHEASKHPGAAALVTEQTPGPALGSLRSWTIFSSDPGSSVRRRSLTRQRGSGSSPTAALAHPSVRRTPANRPPLPSWTRTMRVAGGGETPARVRERGSPLTRRNLARALWPGRCCSTWTGAGRERGTEPAWLESTLAREESPSSLAAKVSWLLTLMTSIKRAAGRVLARA